MDTNRDLHNFGRDDDLHAGPWLWATLSAFIPVIALFFAPPEHEELLVMAAAALLTLGVVLLIIDSRRKTR